MISAIERHAHSTRAIQLILTLLGVFVILFSTSPAHAAEDSLIVVLKSGKRVSVPIAMLQKITFDTAAASSVITRNAEAGSLANITLSENTLSWTSERADDVRITVTDLLGRELLRKETHIAVGRNSIGLTDLSSLARPSIIIVRLQTKDSEVTKLLVR